jgi:hypothetical protein
MVDDQQYWIHLHFCGCSFSFSRQVERMVTEAPFENFSKWPPAATVKRTKQPSLYVEARLLSVTLLLLYTFITIDQKISINYN